MRYLIDTNIALRLVDIDSIQHQLVRKTLGQVVVEGHQIVIVPHVLYELWAVMTRPVQVNGLGWTPQIARSITDGLISQFLFLADVPTVFDHWFDLVTTHQVSGKKAHDARLAATLLAHGLDGLLTFNGPDFKRFGIQVTNPADLSSGGPIP